MAWKLIEGDWRYPYRVSDQGEVQKQLPSGQWRTLKPYPYFKQWRVELRTQDGGRRRELVSKLVVDAFMGGTPPGLLRVHKNGMQQDNAVENIIFLPRSAAAGRQRPGNSRPVLKVDQAGEIVAVYRSGAEAARANFTSQSAISSHCRGRVKDVYRLDGCRYVYEDDYYRKKRGRPRKHD